MIERVCIYLRQLDVNNEIDPDDPINDALSPISDVDTDDNVTIMDSVFDNASSGASSMDTEMTSMTTDSDQAAESALMNDLNVRYYSFYDMCDLLWDTAKKVTWERLIEINEVVQPLQLGFTFAFIMGMKGLTLQECPETLEVHDFSRDQRCVRCEAQICRVSPYYFLLNDFVQSILWAVF